jgi:hypothetical protein
MNDLPDIYRAIDALESFETKKVTHERGVLSAPFFALGIVKSLLYLALDEGDVIAPYFLHYLAKKYKYLDIDTSTLPPLNTIPSYNVNGELWIKNYKHYLKILEPLSTFSSPTFNTGSLLGNINKWKDTDSFSRIYKAKAMEKTCTYMPGSFKTNKIAGLYELAAVTNNIWMLVQCRRFFVEHKLWMKNDGLHIHFSKIIQLYENGGSISSMYKLYSEEYRYSMPLVYELNGQMLDKPHSKEKEILDFIGTQARNHGDMVAASHMLFDSLGWEETMQWYDWIVKYMPNCQEKNKRL